MKDDFDNNKLLKVAVETTTDTILRYIDEYSLDIMKVATSKAIDHLYKNKLNNFTDKEIKEMKTVCDYTLQTIKATEMFIKMMNE